MEFELDDEHVELQRAVRDVVAQRVPARPAAGGDRRRRRRRRAVEDLRRPRLADAGGARRPGGVGAAAVELVITLDELGYVADPTPIPGHGEPVRPAGARVRHRRAAPPPAGRGRRGRHRRGVLRRRCRARPTATADDWVLDGSAPHVLDGDRADVVAVVASTGHGPAVFAVPAGALGRPRQETFDATLHVATLRLDGVRVGADAPWSGPASSGVSPAPPRKP